MTGISSPPTAPTIALPETSGSPVRVAIIAARAPARKLPSFSLKSTYVTFSVFPSTSKYAKSVFLNFGATCSIASMNSKPTTITRSKFFAAVAM